MPEEEWQWTNLLLVLLGLELPLLVLHSLKIDFILKC